MLFENINIKIPGIDIFENYIHSIQKNENFYTVTIKEPMEFQDKHKLFKLGWKNIGYDWIYVNLIGLALENENE